MNIRGNVGNLFPIQVLRFGVKGFCLSYNLLLLTSGYTETDSSPRFVCYHVCVFLQVTVNDFLLSQTQGCVCGLHFLHKHTVNWPGLLFSRV